jgi:1A family penicillin-binding protein
MDRLIRIVTLNPRALVAGTLALAAAFWFTIGATALYAYQVIDGVPERSTLGRVAEMPRASIFYDHTNRAAFSISREQRIEVPLDRMSPHLKQAIIAIEDQRFYDHQGVDVIRIAGAALANVRAGNRGQGASTLTQQLARLSFLTPDKTYTRKLQEALLAALIESEYTKDQILELYLNKVYFGSGFYGAEAAALGYFGKHAADLDVAEAALIAGLVKAPSNYAPTVDLERAIKRRTVVLQSMREMKVIDEPTFNRARTTKVVLNDAINKEEPYGRFFKEHIRRELVSRFGEARVYEGGLKVYTTIDIEMQRAADAEVQRVLSDLDKRRTKRGAAETTALLQASLIAIDPRSGEVRAMIGGRDFIQSNYNRAIAAKRQPGSAFKPFVYAAALEAGFTPATLLENLDEPIDTLQGAWVPEDGHSTASAMTMRSALKTSSNRAAVRMIEDLGIQKAVAYANRVGIQEMPSVPSLALGSGEVTLESLTSAYGVFASQGLHRTPTYIKRVEDQEGNVLYASPYESRQVISPQTSYLMTHMLADVINHGTAWKARQLGFKLPAAGKTGTTNDYVDAWFVGFTPSLVAGVWVGFDQPQTIVAAGYAGDLAVPVWAAFMKDATKGDKPVWLKPPADVVSVQICRMSGRRPASNCGEVEVISKTGESKIRSMIMYEHFVKGTEPFDECPLHTGAGLLARLGGLFGGGSSPQAVAESASPLPERGVEVPPTSGDVAPAGSEARKADQQDEPKKKRGFWGRLFGSRKEKPAADRPDPDR